MATLDATSTLDDFGAYITTEQAVAGRSAISIFDKSPWATLAGGKLRTKIVFSTSSFPPSLYQERDIIQHLENLETNRLGIINSSGTLFSIVDLAPGFESPIHRTQSLDYAIIMQGCVELIMDSGDAKVVRSGEVVVQRACAHAWKNTSGSEWARIAFITQPCDGTMEDRQSRDTTSTTSAADLI